MFVESLKMDETRVIMLNNPDIRLLLVVPKNIKKLFIYNILVTIS